MSAARVPSTPAVLALRAAGVAFTPHYSTYEKRGGTAESARELGVDEHAVIKTLIMQDEAARPCIVLMHGDREVSTKALARAMNVKRIEPCKPEVAERHTGYRVGGTSPFATRRRMPVYLQNTVPDLSGIYINGGSRGFLVGIPPRVVVDLLKPELVAVAAAP
jgi:Cys-tRNA(Pro) deacylase